MRKPSALIIDDEPAMHQMVRSALNDFECTAVTTLALGLKFCEDKEPTVVILDLHLEGEAVGFDGLRLLHARFPRVVIVVFTANQSQADAAFAMQNGAQAYIIKSPTDFNIYNFQAEVVRAIHRHSAYQKLYDEAQALRRKFEQSEIDREECGASILKLQARVEELEAAVKALKRKKWKIRLATATAALGVTATIISRLKEIKEFLQSFFGR